MNCIFPWFSFLMDVPAYEIIFCISKTQYSLCRQHKRPLFHDIVFYAHYTSFAMRCQHNSTLFLLLWLVFLVDFCGFSLFLLKSTIKPKSVFRFSYFDFGKRFSNYIVVQCHALNVINLFEIYMYSFSLPRLDIFSQCNSKKSRSSCNFYFAAIW